ncbi:MAG: VWA domain-containing protein, partial [Vicinamibacterales bacterium]
KSRIFNSLISLKTGAYTRSTSMRMHPATRVAALAALAVAVLLPGRVTVDAQGNARERTLFVSAVDERGVPAPTLAATDLIVREDGARREVLRVGPATEPIDIALLVDNSTAASALIPPMRDGLTRFVTAMTAPGGPRHNIALIGIASRPTVIVDYTSDRDALTRGIGRLFPESSSGMTLLDGLVEVSRGLSRRESARAVLVPVITDGVEFSNRYYADVVQAMTDADAALHAITVGTFELNNEEPIRNRALSLDKGVEATGGQRMTLLTPSAVPGALERLARELSSQFKVVYSRPESLIPPETLEVTSTRPAITVRATPARGQDAGAAR